MILFRTLKYKNFLSAGNYFTNIQLDKKSSTLILGANGSGKSTMLDALCFGLFGKPFRNINKPQLLNSINQKNLIVEIEFDVNNKAYKVVRGIKPNIFEIYCDGILLNQDAAIRDYQDTFEKVILKLNYKSFTQIVILGSASFTPFMQLSASDRRSIIEDLLDIKIFSTMNSLLKERGMKLKNELTNSKYKSESIQEKIEVHQTYIEDIKKDNKEKIVTIRNKIEQERAHVGDRVVHLEGHEKKIEELSETVQEASAITSKMRKLEDVQKDLKKTIKKIDSDVKFYEDNDNCPTCKQSIDSHFKNEILVERDSKKTQVVGGIEELSAKYIALKASMKVINETMASMEEVRADVRSLQNENHASVKYISKLEDELDKTCSTKTNVKEQTNKLKCLQAELYDVEDSVRQMLEDRHNQEIASVLLKDTGIKTKIIKQYVPIINKMVNKYLASMDFFVNFNLDESFKETIKSRHRDDFSYSSFSEGEKQRIDMALMLTWRTIAKLKNSASTNILILDEIFDSSLDNNGTEDLMKLLNILEATNLFVISHKGDILQDKFADVLKFEKQNNFSKMVEQ
jgi:DNA repair exonuclease SbcCD ATPase subunit